MWTRAKRGVVERGGGLLVRIVLVGGVWLASSFLLAHEDGRSPDMQWRGQGRTALFTFSQIIEVLYQSINGVLSNVHRRSWARRVSSCKWCL